MHAIVSNHKTLAAMERRGFIVRHGRPGQTTRHWTGARVKVITVDAGPNLSEWYSEFTYNGKAYRLRYFDGCFHAFVTENGKPLPAFV